MLQWREPTIIQTSNHKDKEWNNKKREESKEEAQVASTSKPKAIQPPQEGKTNKKKNWRKLYPPIYRIPRIQKDAMDNVFNRKKELGNPLSQIKTFGSQCFKYLIRN
ncbi:hypothetical protein O181_038810 [Austropuccinia psidii MF-1]|uniref:Uncharacterized protein n=1 Tax=Austropuccinia psidii MF-1 TaxID=1389203 RepID=A0A9Q3DAF3_9BASI|nr:hypothetical protein [Austropuccinia psidii MF-1]